jgi:hypothetical protein
MIYEKHLCSKIFKAWNDEKNAIKRRRKLEETAQ